MTVILALVGLIAVLAVSEADAQTVYVPHGGRVIAVPIGGMPVEATASTPAPAEGGMMRVDGLPAGAMVAVDGHAMGGAKELSGGWIVLPPGPHFVDVALPGGQALRLTVVTPVESSGYQVVPKP